MQVKIMNTSDGPHLPDTWAENTAGLIVSIADSITGERKGSAFRLQTLLIDILTRAHESVQTGERAMIAERGVARLQDDMLPDEHVAIAGVVAQIVGAAKGSPWETDFQTADFAKQLTILLTDNFMHNAWIERDWHAGRNLNTQEAQAFRSQFSQATVATPKPGLLQKVTNFFGGVNHG